MSNLSDFISTGAVLVEDIHNSNYTFVAGDERAKLHTKTSDTPYNWTIPLNSVVPFQIGSILTIYNGGAGDITIIADGAATLRTMGSSVDGDKTLGENYKASILKVGTDDWVISISGADSVTLSKLFFMGTL